MTGDRAREYRIFAEILPGKNLSENRARKMGWGAVSRDRKALRNAVAGWIRLTLGPAGFPPLPLKRAAVQLGMVSRTAAQGRGDPFYRPDDPDNFLHSCKAVLDALQDVELIVDDRWGCLTLLPPWMSRVDTMHEEGIDIWVREILDGEQLRLDWGRPES